jgi:acetate kinase
MDKEGLNADEIRKVLSKESGMLGISGVGGDLRDIMEAAENGNSQAQLALDAYHYGVKKYIGAYAAAMGGVDVIVFTGGIGQKSELSREAICEGLEFMGVKFDKEKNQQSEGEGTISAKDSQVIVLVVPTNEEVIVARETAHLISNL